MRITTIGLSVAIIASAALLGSALRPATTTEDSVPNLTLSHFDCYLPTSPGPPPPPPRNVVNLTDQFQAFQTPVGQIVFMCTPVMKKLQPGVKPLPTPFILNHLVCYAINGPPINQSKLMRNQLQQQQITWNLPQFLCVPSNKH
jgi:hypothetical protein